MAKRYRAVYVIPESTVESIKYELTIHASMKAMIKRLELRANRLRIQLTKHYSQKAIAKKYGVDVTSVNKINCGKRHARH